MPFKILGGGSNVLVRDGGVEALVIQLESPFFSDVTIEDNLVSVGTAVPLTALISQTARAGLAGLEVLTGIPGHRRRRAAGQRGQPPGRDRPVRPPGHRARHRQRDPGPRPR